jgi:hypothetical protein
MKRELQIGTEDFGEVIEQGSFYISEDCIDRKNIKR